jgi:hypothetical protein
MILTTTGTKAAVVVSSQRSEVFSAVYLKAVCAYRIAVVGLGVQDQLAEGEVALE